MASSNPQEVDVTWDDQKKICIFGRLNQRASELNSLIKNKNGDIQNMGDAADEVYIADEMKVVLGEAFVSMTIDEVEAMLNVRKKESEEDVAKYKSELEYVENRMRVLKGELYAKFGNNIYLENE
eukprot:PhF_6_TR35499/c0_g1_i1/m.51762/K09550/PFDN4; prefoldin subunit 4